MANDGAGAPAQMPPSSFDAAMSQANTAPPPAQAAVLRGVGGGLKLPSSADKAPAGPPNELALGDPDPNDPAELAAREALQRDSQEAPPDNADDSMQHNAEADAAALDEWRKAKDDIRLQESFMDKVISVPWGDKGEMRDVPVAEMKAGYMRTLDHTRKNQAAAEVHRQATQNNANMNAFLTDIQQPAQMRERLEDLGYGPVLHQVAEQIYAEKLAEERHFYDLKKRGASDDTITFMRDRLSNETKLKLQARADARRIQQSEQQAQVRRSEEQQNEQGRQFTHQLNQLRPLAFKKMGMPDDAIHNNAFQQVLMSILQTGGGHGKQLRDVVLEAAESAKQLVEEHISVAKESADQERLRSMGGAQPLSPQRLAGQAPTQGNGVTPIRSKRMGVNDFDAEMARIDGARR